MSLSKDFFDDAATEEDKKYAFSLIMNTLYKSMNTLLLEQKSAVESTEALCSSGYEGCINLLKKRLESRHDTGRDDLITNVGLMVCAYIAYEMENVLLNEMLEDDNDEVEEKKE